MDVRASIDELQEQFGVDEVRIYCWSSAVLESAWVTSERDGLRVTDSGECYASVRDNALIATPDEAALVSICARFDVDVVPNEDCETFVLQRDVPPGGDLRAAVRALLQAQEAISASVDPGRGELTLDED